MPRIQPTQHKIVLPRNEHYVDTDEDGFEQEPRRPKWTKPATEFQRDILHAVGRKYYLKRDERSAVIGIEKGMLSIKESRVISRYPTEWVQNCIAWARDMRRKGSPIRLMSLINLINNEDRRIEFVSEWTRKNGSANYDQSAVI